MAITSVGDINRELAKRCAALGLSIDCAADGSFGAEIAIVGEAPGEREKQTKLPLTGSSGKLFWEFIRPAGVNRRQVYITNVVKRQLRQANDVKVNISASEVSQYSSVVAWELSQLPNLKYIIVLGNYALEAITGYSGIDRHRGSVYDMELEQLGLGTKRTVRVMCMVNPAAVMREPKREIMFRFDVGRFKDVLSGKYSRHDIVTHFDPSPDEAIGWLDRLLDEKLPIALDEENVADEVACYGLANSVSEAYCINFRDLSSNRWSVSDEVRFRRRFQKFLDTPSLQLITQNGMFDSYNAMLKERIRLPPIYADTMLAHHTLYPSLPHNLGFITSQYTTQPFYKDEGKDWKEGGNIEDFWRYNGKDCCVTLEAWFKMHKELVDQGLDQFFFSHVMPLQPNLIQMTVGGVLVDAKLKEKITEELGLEVDRAKHEFLRLAREATELGDDYNPNPASPKQMADLLFRKLRLQGRGVATDEKNRARMRNHPKTPPVAKEMLTALDKYQKEAKFYGTYAKSRLDEDGRSRSEYKQIGVVNAPGRLSAGGLIWGTGTNHQNQPERAKPMFIFDPGYEGSYFDLSQAEARIVAYRAVIHAWIEQFSGKYDAHCALASEMFKVPIEDVPTYDFNEDNTPTIRYKAKRCRHGLNYRMGPDRLAEELQIAFSEAFDLHRIYHRTTPELNVWWKWQTDDIIKTKRMYNAYGRRWILLERLEEDTLESVVAFYPQSTVGDKVSRIITQCHADKDWPKHEARILFNVHDALTAIHKPEHGEVCRQIMSKYAMEPIIVKGMDGIERECIIPCDLKRTVPDEQGIHRWSNMEKVKLAA